MICRVFECMRLTPSTSKEEACADAASVHKFFFSSL